METTIARRTGPLAISLALLTLIAISAVCWQQWQRYELATQQVTKSRRIINLNTELLDQLRDAETGQRGFLLTSRQAYLQPYEASLAHLATTLREIDSLTPGDTNERGRLLQLRPLVAAKLAELKRTIDLRRKGNPQAALELVETDEGRLLMDQIRRLCDGVQTAETTRWRESWNELQNWSNRLRLVSLFGGLLLTALAGMGTMAMIRYARGLEQSIQNLATSKRAEEQSRFLLEATLYSIGDGVIATDKNGGVRLMNRVAEKLTGYREAEASGLGIEQVFRIVNKNTREDVECPVRQVLEKRQVMGLPAPTVLVHRSGAEIAIGDSAAPISGATEGMSGAVLVFRDVTEEHNSRNMERQLATIVEHSDDAIIGQSLTGVVTSWNRAAEKLFGYSAAEMIGNSAARLIPPDHADDLNDILDRVGHGELVERFETERVTKYGKRVTVSLTISAIRDVDGHIIGASKIARDITHQRELEAVMRQTQKNGSRGPPGRWRGA